MRSGPGRPAVALLMPAVLLLLVAPAAAGGAPRQEGAPPRRLLRPPLQAPLPEGGAAAPRPPAAAGRALLGVNGTGSDLLCSSIIWFSDVGDEVVSPGIRYKPDPRIPGPGVCVARYAQQFPSSGTRLGLHPSVFTEALGGREVRGNSSRLTPSACVRGCPPEQCCIVEYELDDPDAASGRTTASCRQALLPPAGLLPVGGDATPRLYYKLPLSDAITPAAAPDGLVRPMSTSSTLYARCSMEQWGSLPADGWVGTSPNPELVEEPRTTVEWNTTDCFDVPSCSAACDVEDACWGFIYVPGFGFTLRAGEDWLASRSFFVSPDPDLPPSSVFGSCPQDSVYDPTQIECILAPAVKSCCLPTCGNAAVSTPPTPYACPGGKSNPAAANVTTVTPGSCCVPTCGSTVVTSRRPVPFKGCAWPAAYLPAMADASPPSLVACCDLAPQAMADVALSGVQSARAAVGEPIAVRLAVGLSRPPGMAAASVDAATASNVYFFGDLLTGAAGLEFADLPAGRGCGLLNRERVACSLGDLTTGNGTVVELSLRGLAAGVYTAATRISSAVDLDTSNNLVVTNVTVLGACCVRATGACLGAASAAECGAANAFLPDRSCATASCAAPPAGTCGNTVPGQSPPVPFSLCPQGSVYNASATALGPPSPQLCCAATCADADPSTPSPQPFACPAGTRPNPAAASAVRPSAAVCCVAELDLRAVPDVAVATALLGPDGLPASSRATAAVGSTLVFRTVVTVADGLAGVYNTRVSHQLQPGLAPVSAAASTGTCWRSGQELICELGFLPYQHQVSIIVTALAVAAGKPRLRVRAAADDDKDPFNDEASVTAIVLGGCCSAGGGAAGLATPAACKGQSGTFFAQRADAALNCSLPTGACCLPDGGGCATDTEGGCAASGGSWSPGVDCERASCPAVLGSCCVRSTGQCYKTTRAACTGAWAANTTCSASLCPPVAVPAFRQCKPRDSMCAANTACQRAPNAYPGAPATFACQPEAATCAGEGQPCGDTLGGGACCSPLTCKWDIIARRGTCQTPDKCARVGGACSLDGDCCRGTRCSANKVCRQTNCNRRCTTPECEAERRLDCGVQRYAVISASAEVFSR